MFLGPVNVTVAQISKELGLMDLFLIHSQMSKISLLASKIQVFPNPIALDLIRILVILEVD